MTATPVGSVVVPVFNGRTTTRDCLDSLAVQAGSAPHVSGGYLTLLNSDTLLPFAVLSDWPASNFPEQGGAS